VAPGFLIAEEPSPEIEGLEKAAMNFVAAYGSKDAAAISLLFTENAEMSNLDFSTQISGRDAIKARYELIFAADDVPDLAVEVASVRLIAPGVAIEDGTVHFTPSGGENEPPRSSTYTAVLVKAEDGSWQIASTRTLKDVTDAAGQLADLAKLLNGDWTTVTADGVRLDLAIGWDPSGKFLSADMLTTAADSEPQEGKIRIGWNAARQSVVSWMFDAEGGVTQGIWTPTDLGWMIRSEGTTAEGETVSANQEVSSEGADALIWKISNRIVDGERQPDGTLRLVPPAPLPAAN
jgi:uncharacterized protein (TIGR02246 family)